MLMQFFSRLYYNEMDPLCFKTFYNYNLLTMPMSASNKRKEFKH